jgi:hypothetical protein
MFSRIAPIVARTAVARSTVAPTAVRGFATITTAAEAAKLSGYGNIEFRIQEDAMVFEAVQQFAANNIGCLVTVNESGRYNQIILNQSLEGFRRGSSSVIYLLYYDVDCDDRVFYFILPCRPIHWVQFCV